MPKANKPVVQGKFNHLDLIQLGLIMKEAGLYTLEVYPNGQLKAVTRVDDWPVRADRDIAQVMPKEDAAKSATGVTPDVSALLNIAAQDLRNPRVVELETKLSKSQNPQEQEHLRRQIHDIEAEDMLLWSSR
jgi:hypothetical protein